MGECQLSHGDFAAVQTTYPRNSDHNGGAMPTPERFDTNSLTVQARIPEQSDTGNG